LGQHWASNGLALARAIIEPICGAGHYRGEGHYCDAGQYCDAGHYRVGSLLQGPLWGHYGGAIIAGQGMALLQGGTLLKGGQLLQQGHYCGALLWGILAGHYRGAFQQLVCLTLVFSILADN
jgi:hypothetical protein